MASRLKPRKALAPAAIQRKIQEAIAVCALTSVYQIRDNMKLEEVKTACFECYHGTLTFSSVSHANQSSATLIDGRAIFNLATTALKNCKNMLAYHQ